ncbi:hypothetical protein MSHOH_0820 [Methanosarcina horonobensis HB-1 = JCM 15518]|uniref:Uncharacterized protein n=2 Tax=Methanosarcina horonobensis TaxID=418008 RepID=A0A0E3SD49_9EURY|nr:hypothetical protein [Methanosarcina horonobensis]AKB77303.1 hypothetical protein MSHOH_0820 [Methanosarcina horonobensis HB-1 = JCM 15518]
MSEMEVEEFIRNVCLTHCLQQMEYFHGQKPEESKVAERAARSENGSKAEQLENMQKSHLKKIEMKGKTTSKDLLDGPLVLDQQCIMDLFAIKRQFCNTSNNKIITVALKLGLNQLSVALDMLKHKLEE